MNTPDHPSEHPLRCPHCGALHPPELLYCPQTGLPIYPPEPAAPSPRRIPTAWIIAGAGGVVVFLCLMVLLVILLVRPASRTATATPPSLVFPTPALTEVILPVQTTPAPGQATQPASATETSPPAPSSTPAAWEACANAAYLSRVRVGDTVRVSNDPPLPNRVRSQASLESNILGYIQPGEEATILEGPGCSNRWVWWKVRSLDTGLEGWTAEGDNAGYWLIPVQP